MSKHSPGPWRWVSGAMGQHTRLRSEAGHTVTRVEQSPASQDAALIACAPELLEMLRELEWTSERYDHHGDIDPCCHACWSLKEHGHKADCRLAAILREFPKEEK